MKFYVQEIRTVIIIHDVEAKTNEAAQEKVRSGEVSKPISECTVETVYLSECVDLIKPGQRR